jgi:hypothetical protein
MDTATENNATEGANPSATEEANSFATHRSWAGAPTPGVTEAFVAEAEHFIKVREKATFREIADHLAKIPAFAEPGDSVGYMDGVVPFTGFDARVRVALHVILYPAGRINRSFRGKGRPTIFSVGPIA